GRQIRRAYAEGLRRASLLAQQLEGVPGKASNFQLSETVPHTDTGARDEYSQALERTREKELGKLTPLLRKKVCPVSLSVNNTRAKGLQKIGGCDCLPKTQHSANTEVDV